MPCAFVCFGFDMENMKVRCWYDHQMPLLAISPEYCENFVALVSHLIAAAKDTVYLLRSQVKAAWFSRPGDAKGDTSMIDHGFWQATEPAFYQHISTLAQLPETTCDLPATIAEQWLALLRKSAEEQFDFWALEGG